MKRTNNRGNRKLFISNDLTTLARAVLSITLSPLNSLYLQGLFVNKPYKDLNMYETFTQNISCLR